jgi:ketosteroid isomerase-like protein
MHPHEARVRELLEAIDRCDSDAVAACYHEEIFFSDAIFPSLRGEEAIAMWRALVGRARDLSVTVESVSADDEGARAIWVARYSRGRDGRPVVTRIDSLFAFRDGLIVRHVDRYSFWRWAAQALGPVGAAFGWFAPFKWWVRKRARRVYLRD